MNARPSAPTTALAICIVSSALAAGTWLFSAEARAQSNPLILSWTGPPECPSEQDVRRRVDELLGAPADQVLRELMSVRGDISHDGKWRLRLATVQGFRRGDRDLAGDSCQEVSLAAALVIALAIDPEAARRHVNEPGAVAAFADLPPPKVESVEQPPPPAPPVETSGRVAQPEPPPPVLFKRASVFVAGGAVLGVLPGAGLGIVGGAAYELGPVRFEVAALSLWPTQRAESKGNPNKRVQVELVAGRLSVCYRIEMRRIEPALCGGVEAGDDSVLGTGFHAEGKGFVKNETKAEPWVAFRAGPRAALWLSEPLAMTLRMDALVPLGRPEFQFRRTDGTEELLHRPSVIAGAAEIGFEVAFQ